VAIGTFANVIGGDGGYAEGLWTGEICQHALHRYLDRRRDDDHETALRSLGEPLFAVRRAALDLESAHLERLTRDQGEALMRAAGVVWGVEMVVGDDVSLAANDKLPRRIASALLSSFPPRIGCGTAG
jgi:hypothetical protein